MYTICIAYMCEGRLIIIMSGVNITFRTDENIKKEAEKTFREMGINMTTGLNLYLAMVANEKQIPFIIRAKSQNNQRQQKHENQLAYISAAEEKKEAIDKLDGILAGYKVDLDKEREERILNR